MVTRPGPKTQRVRDSRHWNTMDLGYLTIHVATALAKGALKPGQTSFTAGRLGSLRVAADNVLLGPPFTFTRENVDHFDF